MLRSWTYLVMTQAYGAGLVTYGLGKRTDRYRRAIVKENNTFYVVQFAGLDHVECG